MHRNRYVETLGGKMPNYAEINQTHCNYIMHCPFATHLWQLKQKDYLIAFSDNSRGNELWGFKSVKNKVVIKPIYAMVATDTMYKIAFVTIQNRWEAVDREGKIIFTPFIFDNGPDYIANGLFRIVKGNKIGYADMSGHIIIEPQFDCAYPFENNKAKVGMGCTLKTIGEQAIWTGGIWHSPQFYSHTLPQNVGSNLQFRKKKRSKSVKN